LTDSTWWATWIDRLPQLGDKGSYVKQMMQTKLVEHKQYIAKYGKTLPEIDDWKWGPPPAARKTFNIHYFLLWERQRSSPARERGSAKALLTAIRAKTVYNIVAADLNKGDAEAVAKSCNYLASKAVGALCDVSNRRLRSKRLFQAND